MISTRPVVHMSWKNMVSGRGYDNQHVFVMLEDRAKWFEANICWFSPILTSWLC